MSTFPLDPHQTRMLEERAKQARARYIADLSGQGVRSVRSLVRRAFQDADDPASADVRQAWYGGRRGLVAAGFVLLAWIGLIAAFAPVSDPPRNGRTGLSACQPWDEAATQVLSGLVRDWRDAELRGAGKALALIQRARRNCEAGWPALACADYAAAMRHAAHGGQDSSAMPAAMCSSSGRVLAGAERRP